VRVHHLPNMITLLRIVLVVPLAGCMLAGEYGAALLLLAFAGLSDGVDGYLARRFGWYTHLGAILDPAADKILMVTLFLVLGWMGHLPFWLVVLVITRDGVIVAGAVAYRLLFGPYSMEPTWISKINTAVQIALVLAVMFSLAVTELPSWLPTLLIGAATATTVASGITYVAVWSGRAWRTWHGATQ